MFLYTALEAVAAIVLGIFVAARTKKAEGVVYSTLDKVGCATNIILTVSYACLSPFYLFLGMISTPKHDGILGILGWIVSVIIASAALFCGLGLGYSVSLRKQGRSKLSFAVQFAGVVGIGLTVLLYGVFVGNLISPLN